MTDAVLRGQPISDLAPAAYRKQAEHEFGPDLEKKIHRAGVNVVDVERTVGLGPSKIYRYFRGLENFRAAWLALLPPAVEQLYLAERAAHHGLELRPVGDADSRGRTLYQLVIELGDVTRAAAESESDGHQSVEDCDRELAEIAQAQQALADRAEYLRQTKAARGAVVVMPRRGAR